MILEGVDARIHFIPHNPVVESARQKRLLRPDTFVHLSRIDEIRGGRIVIEDLGNAEDYLNSERFAAKARRLLQQGAIPSGSDWGGWLGRYERALHSVGAAISKTRILRRGQRI